MPRRSLSDRVTDSFRVISALDLSHAYERQAGTIALAVLTVVALVVAVATGRLLGGEPAAAVTVEAPASGGLARGDPVLVRGVRVGRVEHVRLAAPGRVDVAITVAHEYAPRADATARVVALDLVGSAGVAYDPGTAAQPLAEGRTVPGESEPSLQERLQQLGAQAGTTAAALRRFDRTTFAADVEATRLAFERARAAAATFPAESLLTATTALLGMADALLARVDAVRDTFPAEVIAARRDTLAQNASALMAAIADVQASLGQIRERTARGDGNVYRFTRDSVFRQELEAARASLEALQVKYLGRRPAADSR